MIDFFDRIQKLLRTQQILFAVARPDVVIANHAFFIDDDVGSLRGSGRFVVNPVCLHDFTIAIAQQWKGDFGEIGEGFLGKCRVGADADYFGILRFK